jgi:hypothetical protein
VSIIGRFYVDSLAMPDRGSFHLGTLVDAAAGTAGEDVVLGRAT